MGQRRIRLITHTGCDMPLAEAEDLGIRSIPDIVIFDEQEFQNMTELSADDFYKKLEASKDLPTTSHPSVGAFVRAFREAAEELEIDSDKKSDEESGEILCLIITSKMSGTYTAAATAAQMVKRQGMKVPVYVYDTQQCSHGMAQMVRAAAELAAQGLDAQQIMEELTALQPKVGVYFVLDSLKNARKGGRVGAVKAFAAEALGIKPLLLFADGLVQDFALVRGYSEGIKKVVARFLEEADFRKPVTVFHAASPEHAESLKQKLIEAVQAELQIQTELQIRTEMVGPVIGVYTGAGCAGIAFTKKQV